VTASEWIKSYVEHHAGIEPTPEEIWNAARAELREPGPCGHPKACWVDGVVKYDNEVGHDVFTDEYHCTVCAELAINLIRCARCNWMKECLSIETGFAGEHEPMCAECLSVERAESEAAANLEKLRAVRDEVKESYAAYCHWFESDSSLTQLEHMFEEHLAAAERAVKAEEHGNR
jgi:hypothetical protein